MSEDPIPDAAKASLILTREQGLRAIAQELARTAQLLLDRANEFQKAARVQERFIVAVTDEPEPGQGPQLVIP